MLISSPGNGEWGGINKKIKVRLLRRANLASEWGNYTSIEVALRNRGKKNEVDEPDEDLYSLTIGGSTPALRTELGTLFINKSDLRTVDDLTVEGEPSNNVTGKATYKRRSRTGHYDSMEFEFGIMDDTADDEPNYEKVYALVTFISTPIGGGGVTLSSHDTETQIFPGTTIDVVGDGKFVKLDREPPNGELFESGDVTVVNNKGVPFAAANATRAIINRYIRTEARLGAVFRDHKVKFQLVPIAPEDDDPDTDVDETTVYDNFEGTLVGYDGEIVSTDLFDSVDPRTVIDSVKVTTGQFKLKYKMDVLPDIKKGDTVERDNLTVRVQITVEDAAGNEMVQTFDPVLTDLTLDSKKPKITITYPDSAHHRFTEKVSQEYPFLGEDEDQVQDLNPLVFTSDEPLNLGANQLQVIVGDDTLKVKAGGASEELGEDGNGTGRYVLDLTADTPDDEDDDANFTHTNKNADRKKKAPRAEAGQAGSARALKIIAKDAAGNLNNDVPDQGVPIYDATPPTISRLFPNEEDLEGETYEGRIGGDAQTHFPRFRMAEEADSILVRYVSGLDDVKNAVGTVAQLGETTEDISFLFTGNNALDDGESYSLQVYVRDLAMNVKVSEVQENLQFVNSFVNPGATKFKVVSQARGEKNDDDDIIAANRDSVVAGQVMNLLITAQNAAKATIVTYREDGVKVEAKDANDVLVPSVRFYGKGNKGVTDNGDGSATLDSDGWGIGKRTVYMYV